MTSFARKRIAELRDLQPGWWGPGSEAIAVSLLDDLDCIVEYLEINYQVGFSASPDGAIHFEWETTLDQVERFHALEYDTEEIWSYSWTEVEGDEGVEETFPYSIEKVQDLIEQAASAAPYSSPRTRGA